MSLPRIQLSEFSPERRAMFFEGARLRDDMLTAWLGFCNDRCITAASEREEAAQAHRVYDTLTDLEAMLNGAADRLERERLRAAVARPYPRTAPCAVECRGDGGQVCALIGPNLAEGVSGYGDTLPDALRALADAIEKETAGCGQEGPPTNA